MMCCSYCWQKEPPVSLCYIIDEEASRWSHSIVPTRCYEEDGQFCSLFPNLFFILLLKISFVWPLCSLPHILLFSASDLFCGPLTPLCGHFCFFICSHIGLKTLSVQLWPRSKQYLICLGIWKVKFVFHCFPPEVYKTKFLDKTRIVFTHRTEQIYLSFSLSWTVWRNHFRADWTDCGRRRVNASEKICKACREALKSIRYLTGSCGLQPRAFEDFKTLWVLPHFYTFISCI